MYIYNKFVVGFLFQYIICYFYKFMKEKYKILPQRYYHLLLNPNTTHICLAAQYIRCVKVM